MNIDFMRALDDWFGPILCFPIQVFLRLKAFLPLPQPNLPDQDVRLIVLQKYFGMGSTLHAIPLIRALRYRYPDAVIVFITFKPMEPVCRVCALADEVVVIPTDSIVRFAFKVVGALLNLRRRGVDLTIDLEFFAKFPLLISVLSGARIRLGLFQRNIRPSGILTHPIYYNTYRPLREIFFAFAMALNIERQKAFFERTLPSGDELTQSDWRKELGLDVPSSLVVINPNAGEMAVERRWPKESFIQLIRLMLQHYPQHHYVLIGSSSEREYTLDVEREACKGMGRTITNLAGRTGLTELFDLLSTASLVISSDTGPMHVASLYGTPLVTFFGPETPVVYGPVNANALVFYSEEMYCSPCLNVYDGKRCVRGKDCTSAECLERISPEDVFTAIQAWIKRGGPGWDDERLSSAAPSLEPETRRFVS